MLGSPSSFELVYPELVEGNVLIEESARWKQLYRGAIGVSYSNV